MTIVSELFGTDKIAGAMGFRALFMGIAILGIPLITGYLIDITGSYVAVQYVFALISLSSSILLLIVYRGVQKRIC